MQDLFAFSEINHSVRDYMPNCTTDFSPFSPRVRLGKKREEMSSSKTVFATKNPSVAGSATSSTTSTEEDSDESNENISDDEEEGVVAGSGAEEVAAGVVGSNSTGITSFRDLFPTSSVVTVQPPQAGDLLLYR